MEEVYMIPQNDINRLVQFYKGEFPDNALLTKAARLAATKHKLAAYLSRPATLVIAKTNPISHELTKAAKGPGTKLERRLKQGAPGINRLARIVKQHDIDYSHANSIQDKWKADAKMIKAIDKLPGKKTTTERLVIKIMQTKKKLKLLTTLS